MIGKQVPVQEAKVIHNCHVHLFNIQHIPRHFISKWAPTDLAVRIAKRPRLTRLIMRLFSRQLNRYSAFLYSALNPDNEGIFKELQGYYPGKTKFVPLSVDFDFMFSPVEGEPKSSQPKKNFREQLKDLAALKRKYPENLYPFVGADPRREAGLLPLVKEYIEEHDFTGIKMYPSMGFFPNDKWLMHPQEGVDQEPLYAYAERNQIPITVHCIPKNQNHYRAPVPVWQKEKVRLKFIHPIEEEIRQTEKELEEAVEEENSLLYSGFGEEHEKFNLIRERKKELEKGLRGRRAYIRQMEDNLKRNYDFAMFYNHPKWWMEVLEKYPRLKINLAHFGGNKEWDYYLNSPEAKQTYKRSWYYMIRNMLEEYENVYADISFTVFDDQLFPVLKDLLRQPKTRNKVLFGSDFYMLQKDYFERRFGFNVKGYLDDDDYWQIAYYNPRRFLHNKIQDDFPAPEEGG